MLDCVLYYIISWRIFLNGGVFVSYVSSVENGMHVARGPVYSYSMFFTR